MNENEFEHTRRPRDAEAVERGLIHDAATAAVEGGFGGAAWTLGNLAVQDAWDKITPPKEGARSSCRRASAATTSRRATYMRHW